MKKKLINVLCTLLIAALAVMALIVVISKLQNKVTFLFGKSVVWVETGSMEGEEGFPARSYILIEKVNDASTEVEVGDVITFYSEAEQIKGKLNTHRVVSVNDDGTFTTKGDANGGADTAPVPFENVVGKYVKNLPVLTVIGRVVLSDVGFPILMVLLFAMICAVYIPDIVRAVSRKDSAESEPSQSQTEHDEEIRRRIAEEVERLKQVGGDIAERQHENVTTEKDVENSQTNGENKDV